MTDPVRWRDDPRAPAAVRQLLAAAPPVAGLPESLRQLDALRLPAALPRSGIRSLLRRSWQRRAPVSSVGGASAGVGSPATLTAVKVAVLLAAAGVSAAVVAHFWKAPQDHGSNGEASQMHPADPRPEPPPPPLEAPASRSNTVVPASSLAPPATRAPLVAHRSPARIPGVSPSSPRPATPASDPLLAEAQSLKAIRQLSDPAQQLRALENHARQFPSGHLLSERRVLEIQAHLALGQKAEAQRVAAELRAQDPEGFRAYGIDRLRFAAPASGSEGPAPHAK